MWSSVKAWILKHDALMPICIAAVFAIIAITIVLFLIYKTLCRNPVRDGSSHNNTVAMTRLGMIEYSVEELEEATDNFREDNIVAIKRLAGPLRPRFLAEVINLSNIRHCNVVKLLGYCCENEQQMLVYEHVFYGNMRDRLRGSIIDFTFKKRIWIAIGAARGLLHLHSLTPPLAHNRFSTTASVLLDSDLEAKVSDVGLSRLLETIHEEANDDHDLEVGFYNQWRFDGTSDVYSFGLFLVELISGEEPGTLSPDDMHQWLTPRIGTSTFADERMNGRFTRVALESVTEIIWRCLAFPTIRRPKMEKIVMDLEEIYLNNFIPTGEECSANLF